MEHPGKPELRRRLKSERQNLGIEQVAVWSRVIVERCLEMVDWARVKSLHTYLPIAANNEVDTWPLLKTMWRQWPEVITAAPRLKPDKEIESVKVGPGTQWKDHAMGIPEPVEGELLAKDYQFDVIIVPALGFDKQGYRLGYGGGYYDRFLANQTQAMTIGFCYQFGLVETGLPHEQHDIPLKLIITEQNVYDFRVHTS